MRSPWHYFFILLLVGSRAFGQSSGVGGGVYFAVGLESRLTPGIGSPVSASRVGVYAEWLRPAIHPGLDLRGEAGTLGLRGTLIGPRASMTLGWLHPYAEFLAGPNHASYEAPGTATLSNQLNASTDREGITFQGTVGADADLSEHFRWRLLEFSQSRFSGISGSRPYAFTTGIVLHFR